VISSQLWRCLCAALAIYVVLGAMPPSAAGQTAAPIKASEVPQHKKIAPLPPRGTYKPQRTSWGDPAIAGAYNNSDESGIPFERPQEFAGRTHRIVSQDGWEEVAEYALTWALEHEVKAAAPAPTPADA